LETVSWPVTVLAALAAATYVTATLLVLRKRWRVSAGNPVLSALAAAAFVLQRLFPQNVALAALACVAVIAALLPIVRRSSSAPAAVLAALPAAAMLLVVDRPFFPSTVQTGFQYATIGVLCAAAPVGIISLLLGSSASRTRSGR
jgi:hypothetical protein